MKNPVHLLFGANARYILPLCVALASVLDHFAAKRGLVVHIISNEDTPKDHENVRRTVEMSRVGLEPVAIHWYRLDPSLTAHLHVPSDTHLSSDVYSPIAAPLVLPETCEKVIYLDCDVVVLKDLSILFDSTVEETSLHAVQEVATPWVSSPTGVFDYQERGIAAGTPYFNSGVLVLNLKRWRERNLAPAILDYVARNGEQILATDQGAMNAFLHHDWTPLDLRWNQGFNVLFPAMWTAAGYSRKDWLVTKNDPYIVHFSGPKKPWQRTFSPRRSYFYPYLEKTSLRDTVPYGPGLEGAIGVSAYYQLWKWGRRLLGLEAS